MNFLREKITEVKFEDIELLTIENVLTGNCSEENNWKFDNRVTTMYVLSNKERDHGAGALLNQKALDIIAENLGDFYVLPSSIHEVIVIAKESHEHIPRNELDEMVREINHTQVAMEERLANESFLYNSLNKSLTRKAYDVL